MILSVSGLNDGLPQIVRVQDVQIASSEGVMRAIVKVACYTEVAGDRVATVVKFWTLIKKQTVRRPVLRLEGGRYTPKQNAKHSAAV